MTSVSHVAASPAVAATVSSAAATSASPVAPKPKPVAPQNAGPAAIVQISQKALAKLQGDKDWQPGMKVDNF